MFETAMQQWEAQGMQDGSKVGWRDAMQNGIEWQEAGEEPAENRRSNELRL